MIERLKDIHRIIVGSGDCFVSLSDLHILREHLVYIDDAEKIPTNLPPHYIEAYAEGCKYFGVTPRPLVNVPKKEKVPSI
jgi:hypothetical protein